MSLNFLETFLENLYIISKWFQISCISVSLVFFLTENSLILWYLQFWMIYLSKIYWLADIPGIVYTSFKLCISVVFVALYPNWNIATIAICLVLDCIRFRSLVKKTCLRYFLWQDPIRSLPPQQVNLKGMAIKLEIIYQTLPFVV